MDSTLSNLKFDSNGLIPAIIQDAASGQVLMMAWMNRDSLDKTVQTGKTHFFQPQPKQTLAQKAKPAATALNPSNRSPPIAIRMCC